MLPTVAEPHTPRFIPITQDLRAIRARNKVTDGVIVNRHMGSEAPPYARPLLVEE